MSTFFEGRQQSCHFTIFVLNQHDFTGHTIHIDRGTGDEDVAMLLVAQLAGGRRVSSENIVGSTVGVAAIDAPRRVGQSRQARRSDRRAEAVVWRQTSVVMIN